MALKSAKYKVRAAGADARYVILPAAESAVDLVGSALADTRSKVVPAVTELASDARDRIGPALDDARQKVGPALEDARKRVAPALDDARKKVGPALDDARKKVGPALDDARQKVGPALEEAKSKVGPVVDDAVKRVTPALEEARDRVAPVASTALEQGRYHGTRLAQTAAAQGRLQGQRAAIRMGLIEEPKTSHKMRNALLVLLGLAGLAAVAYKKFLGRDSDPAWTMGRDAAAVGGSHRTPPVAPAPPTDAAHDVGGGELDESMATDEGAAARHAATVGTTRGEVDTADTTIEEAGTEPGAVAEDTPVGTDEPVAVVPPVPGDVDEPASTPTGEAATAAGEPPTAQEVAEADSSTETSKPGSRKKRS